MGNMAPLCEPASQLTGGRGFTGPLQTRHQDNGRRLHRQRQFARIGAKIAPHQARELAMHHTHQGLTGRQAADNLFTQSFFFDLGHEFTYDRQRYVGLKQG